MQNNKYSGDSNEITREYFDSLLVEMRHIDAVVPSTSFELYGEKFSTPIMTAALSHLNGLHPDGMVELARGAFAANSVMWTGMGDDKELEEITATGAKTIKIIKPYADNHMIYNKIEHSKKNGAIAVGMDIDHAFNHKGQPDTVLGLPMTCKSLNEIKEFIKAAEIPFVIKGVLSEQDAYKCLEAGAKGIVVSHHHGILNYAIPPLMILPKIVKLVNKEIPVFVDCGIVNGLDVFKALALGATAVSVGRALMDPLKEDGAKGVKNKIISMTEELSGAMARTCSADIATIDPTVIWHKQK